MKKIVIAVLVFIILIGGGYWLMHRNPTAMNAWKTYTNTDYGFSFEYPAYYSVNRTANHAFDDGISLFMFMEDKTDAKPGMAIVTLPAPVEQFLGTSGTEESVTIGTLSGKKYTLGASISAYPDLSMGNLVSYIFSLSSQREIAFAFDESVSTGDRALFEKIIATLAIMTQYSGVEAPTPVIVSDQSKPATSDYELNLPTGFKVVEKTDSALVLQGPYIYSTPIPPGGESLTYSFVISAKDSNVSLTDWLNANAAAVHFREGTVYTQEDAAKLNAQCLPADPNGYCGVPNCRALGSNSTADLYDCGRSGSHLFLVKNDAVTIISIPFGQDPPMAYETLLGMIYFK